MYKIEQGIPSELLSLQEEKSATATGRKLIEIINCTPPERVAELTRMQYFQKLAHEIHHGSDWNITIFDINCATRSTQEY